MTMLFYVDQAKPEMLGTFFLKGRLHFRFLVQDPQSIHDHFHHILFFSSTPRTLNLTEKSYHTPVTPVKS